MARRRGREGARAVSWPNLPVSSPGAAWAFRFFFSGGHGAGVREVLLAAGRGVAASRPMLIEQLPLSTTSGLR